MLWFWQHYLVRFLNSSFFIALTTFLVGWAAYLLYLRQLKDQKKTAANLVVLEIKSAAQQLKEIEKIYTQYKVLRDSKQDVSNQKMFPEKIQIMKTENWPKYRHLFSSSTSPELLSEIDEYYLNCHYLDEALSNIDGVFSKNEAEIRTNMFSTIAKYMNSAADGILTNPTNDPEIAKKNNDLVEDYKNKLDAFKNAFPTAYSYRPIKYFNDAEYYAELLINSKLTARRVEEALKQAY